MNDIPNNVDLAHDKKLQRALLDWQPRFLSWWRDMGPMGFDEDQIYLRTAVSVEEGGWASFGHVKMSEYRWGIFLAPPGRDRTIAFGDNIGKPLWDEVPGEVRKELRRLIVTQADTEPASVEQQRKLGRTAPSLYDLRNLFQVNVEEARHLWAMVYLLHRHFGKDGRDEAEDLLVRRSGDADSPRLLETFNKPVEDWLSFFCFTMFTDRDGKYQLGALAESSFDPLARSTQFMLTEEAHHLFVGESGITRILARTAELMRQEPNGEVEKLGGIPFAIVQKYVNEWYSSSLDLFGSESSSNAAAYFAAGLKGRFNERKSKDIVDHVALEERRAMNAILQRAYRDDCAKAVERCNRVLERAGVAERLTLPDERFNRHTGVHAGLGYTPDGSRGQPSQFLPTAADRAFVQSLMRPVYEPGKYASWIAPPAKGINGEPLDFEYVKRAVA